MPVTSNGERASDKENEKASKKRKEEHPNPYAVYLYVTVGLLGGSGGFFTVTFLYLGFASYPVPESDWFYWIATIVAIICGATAAIWFDEQFQMDQAFAWQRLPIALILGVLLGPVGLVLVSIVIIVSLVVAVISLLINDSKSHIQGPME